MIKDIPQSLLDAVMKVLTEAHEEHPMIEVDGVMKHRLNSLGQPIHSTDEGIRNFHRWFGDSQVVDEHGRPQVVFHATKHKFDSFDYDKIGNGYNRFGPAFYFTNDSKTLDIYKGEGGNLIPAYIRASKIQKTDAMSKEDINNFFDSLQVKKFNNGYDATNDHENIRNSALEEPDRAFSRIVSSANIYIDKNDFLNGLHKIGVHATIRNVFGHPEYAVYDNTNIKSTKNSGAFNHPTKITESIEHPMIEVDGVMRHRNNSLGQPIHHTDEGIRNFHRWFGDSKAVDEQGRPKVFYHGTGADFSEFKTSGGHSKTFGTGTFFSDNSQIASTYAVGNMRNVIPVYLNIASPVIVDANDKNWNSIQQKSSVQIPLKSGKSKSTTVKSLFKGEFDYPDDTVSTDDIARWTRLNGHHGLLIKNVIDHGPTRYGEEPRSPSTLIVAFHPHQIKSALGNSGAFSHPTKITESTEHPMIEVDGVLKHRHNSLGQPIHHTEEDIKNFHRWFGDSKAVDEHGRPLVVYHGSNAHAYSDGSIDRFHTNTERGAAFFSSHPEIAKQYGEKLYSTYVRLSNPLIVDGNNRSWSDLSSNSKISGNITPELHVADQKKTKDLNNIFSELGDLFGDEDSSSQVKRKFEGLTHLNHALSDITDKTTTDDVAKHAKKLGYDGVIFRNIKDSPVHDVKMYSPIKSDIYAVFKSPDVKSTQNSGKFRADSIITESIDPKQHNISMSQSTGADKSKWVNFSLKDDSGKQIGSLMLSSHDDGANYSVREANVDPAHRGLGHGKAMYLAAINFAKENNANLTSDKSISVDANKVWNSIRKMDIDVTRHPNVKFVADKLRTHRNIDIDGKSVSIPSDEPVWKYTNKQSAITESEEDYRGSHTAPGPDYGAPAHDLTRDIYPEDFYSSKGSRLYGDGRDDDYKVHSQLRTLHNRPDAEVNIYRAVPNDSKITEINPGDWVTTNLQYAHDHGERFDSHKILSKRVKAKEIFTDGNSFHEFGYHPQD